MISDSLMKSLDIKLILLFISSVLVFIAVSSVTPPFMSPDEPHHFSRAYLLTNGVITLDNKEGVKSGGYIDSSLNDSLITFNNGHVKKVTPAMFSDLDNRFWGSGRSYKEIPNTAFYFPAVYIPQALGISVGRLLNLSILDTYQISRVLAFLACISILFYANTIYRIPALALAVMVMPMMVFQFVATTIDGLTTSLAVLMMCLFAKCITEEKVDTKSLILISIIAFVLVSSRANLIPILLLPFVTAYYYRSKFKFLAPIISSSLAMGWISLTILLTKDGGVNHPGISQGQVIAHYITHPLDILRISYNTVSDYGRSSFYFKSFVGKLGWLDIWLPNFVYVISASAILMLIALTYSHSKIKKLVILCSSVAIASVGSVVLIFCALLVQYSNFPTDVIIGVQGRYFVIPAIIASFMLMTDRNMNKAIAYAIVISLLMVSLGSMIPSIVNRYYM